ncbi:hypothetical protein H6P81_011513 [Aristolochia fimbriata]|uniref:Uncharacterized protein n=1 Tax=Aristolochia fimbriata TaxID=158543 RepID=A0AAV7EW77_ARIFI|nr:hypothetical protein H6P81_011513 [Aristolochia fimbriata]
MESMMMVPAQNFLQKAKEDRKQRRYPPRLSRTFQLYFIILHGEIDKVIPFQCFHGLHQSIYTGHFPSGQQVKKETGNPPFPFLGGGIYKLPWIVMLRINFLAESKTSSFLNFITQKATAHKLSSWTLKLKLQPLPESAPKMNHPIQKSFTIKSKGSRAAVSGTWLLLLGLEFQPRLVLNFDGGSERDPPKPRWELLRPILCFFLIFKDKEFLNSSQRQRQRGTTTARTFILYTSSIPARQKAHLLCQLESTQLPELRISRCEREKVVFWFEEDVNALHAFGEYSAAGIPSFSQKS